MKSFLIISLAFVCGVLVTVVGGSSPCDHCEYHNGVYVAPHATVCKYYHCKRQTGASTWDSEVRLCPEGLFWNAATLTCDWPVHVNSASDSCVGVPDGTTVADPCHCYGYFICDGGLSVAYQTCSDGFRYDGSPCTADATCNHQTTPQPPNLCSDKSPHSDNDKYYWTVHGTTHTMTCPEGTVWSQPSPSQCGCIHGPTVPPQCNQLVDIDFNTDEPGEYSSQNLQFQTVGGRDVAYFDGTAKLSIPLTTNMGDLEQLAIVVTFQETFTDSDNYYLLFSNCACGSSSSIRSKFDKHSTTHNRICSIADTNSGTPSICADSTGTVGDWKTHVYKYDSGAFFIQLGAATASATSGEHIENRLSAIHFAKDNCGGSGNCEGLKSFKGYIDLIRIYRCIP